MKRILFFVLLLQLSSLSAEVGGSGGNGGDGVYCSWRKPMVLDYYASGFMGGLLYGSFSPILDIYQLPGTVGQKALDILQDTLNATSKDVLVNGTGKTEIEEIKKRLSKALKRIGRYEEWKLVDDIPVIKDSIHDDFLPMGCEVRQVARADGHHVQVNRHLFEQLDQKQKEVLALHEALYLVGREHYGHQNSFLTRNLIRAILRRGGNKADQEVYVVINQFIKNILPEYALTINEDVPGSGTFNTWRLNVFDLKGEFILEEGQDALSCPRRVKTEVEHNLHFSIFPFDFRSMEQEFQSFLGQWVQSGFISHGALTALSLKEEDRAIIFIEEGILRVMGLNRKDQFYMISSSYKGMGPSCIYKRRIK